MVMHLLCRVKRAITRGVLAVRQHLAASTKPTNSSLVRGSLQDLARTKPQLIAENALLRQQLIVLNRSVKRPCLTATDRSLLVLLASRVLPRPDARTTHSRNDHRVDPRDGRQQPLVGRQADPGRAVETRHQRAFGN